MMKPQNDIISGIGIERVKTRYEIIYQEMTEFIVIAGLEKYITVNCDLLFDAINNYFKAVSRIEEYYMDELKVTSYMACHLLKSKPIVMRDNVQVENDKLNTINERFVLLFLLNYVSGQLGNTHILLQTDIEMKMFCKYLFYMLITRFENANCLIAVISSFLYNRIQ